jgi:hypothetical protein
VPAKLVSVQLTAVVLVITTVSPGKRLSTQLVLHCRCLREQLNQSKVCYSHLGCTTLIVRPCRAAKCQHTTKNYCDYHILFHNLFLLCFLN